MPLTEHTGQGHHTLTLAPDLSETARVRELLGVVGKEAGFFANRLFDITVAVSEAAANAVEHADAAGEVQVDVYVHPDRLEAHIAGPGEFRLQDQSGREHRGLGLPLMAMLSDHLALYSRAEGGTLVALTFFRRPQQKADTPLPPAHTELVEEKNLLDTVLSAIPVGMFLLDEELRFRWSNPSFSALLGSRKPAASADLVGQPFEGVVPSCLAEPITNAARQLCLYGLPSMTGDASLADDEESQSYWRWELRPFPVAPGQCPHVLGLVEDVTDRLLARRRADALAQELEGKVEAAEEAGRRQRQLQQFAREVLTESTTDELLQRTVDAACELTGSDMGAAGLGYHSGVFHVKASSRGGSRSPFPTGSGFVVDRGGVYMEVVEKNRTLRLGEEDLLRHPLWWGLPKDHAPLSGFLAAPLRVRSNRAEGLVMVSWKRKGDYSEEDELGLTQLADLASLGLRHVDVRHQLEDRGEPGVAGPAGGERPDRREGIEDDPKGSA